MESCFAQTLEHNKMGQDEQSPRADDLMAKYLVCKSLPRLIIRLLLRFHGSALLNVNMKTESEYFAVRDISK